MKSRLTIMSLLFLFLSALAKGGVNQWTFSMPEGGKMIPLLAIPTENGSVLFTGTESHGVFKSADGGKNWQEACPTGPKQTVYDFDYRIEPEKITLYIGSWGEGLFQSTDFGETCVALNENLPDKNVAAIAVGAGGGLYVGLFGKGIFSSSDGGVHWGAINSGLSDLKVYSLAFDPENNLYASVWTGGVFKLAPGSEQWQAINTGLPSLKTAYLSADFYEGRFTLYVAVYKEGLFKSTDGGLHWVADNAGLPQSKEYLVPAKMIRDSSGNLLLAFNGAGIYRKGVQEESWTPLTPQGLESLAVSHLAITEQGRLLVSTFGGGIFRLNEANRWESVLRVKDAIPLNFLIDDSGTLFLGTDVGLYQFKNQSWSYTSSLSNHYIPSLAKMGEVLYLSNWFFVLKSTDGGKTWQEASRGLEGRSQIKVFAFSQNPASLLFAATDNGIYKSIDGGGNWKRVEGIPEGTLIRTLGALPVENSAGTFLARTESGNLYASSDQGETWQQATNEISDLKPQSFACNPSNSACYAALEGDSTVYKTTDGGQSWRRCGELPVAAATRDLAFDGEALFVATDGIGSVHQSSDGCESWKSVGEPMPVDGVPVVEAYRSGEDLTLFALAGQTSLAEYHLQTNLSPVAEEVGETGAPLEIEVGVPAHLLTPGTEFQFPMTPAVEAGIEIQPLTIEITTKTTKAASPLPGCQLILNPVGF